MHFQDIRTASPHFHERAKGCRLKKIVTKHGKTTLKAAYCGKHQVETCRCGWRWEFHSPFRDPFGVVALRVVQ